ncbi:MAG: hypothetical protein KUA37_08340 [Desulfomicrobium sp.]|uniref:Carbon monoxide dehydrogenase n=1 Tax=Desulfomicrobium macestii TaxID=90731 RepID=A0ABR9H451_9BACT|nr:carbon monoxide dehydrogenase beta subunit family protein [Desulfomicrobium macestii]MBE1425493.1 hypothetical protein [Desulfomicrobium macestii]MBV1711998.1 hypothetical protein [Desulfomicrobium sp.]MBV1719382.1 hypothetical protein [Desulfomicrobium sp.]MBV1749647.1 hypothetical protein [Desulfomicrobium sp.]
MKTATYKVVVGPEGYLPPAAATRGVTLPDTGQAIMEGALVDVDAAMSAIAQKLVSAKNPVFFPGPLILWDWKPGVAEKAIALKSLAEVVGAKIIPMPDYRPKYPMINPAIEVNPNHPNLTIWHNKIDVCLFIGVHCHYANVALKIIRGGTDCYTVALCAEAGHEDAMISLRDSGICELQRLRELVNELKAGRAND